MIASNLIHNEDTICALATPSGNGAIAVIRMSGNKCFEVLEGIFTPAKKDFSIASVLSHTIHFGKISDKEQMVDEVLVSVFRNPTSYTGEDLVEISCHGSVYIQQKIISILQEYGVRMAEPGEFTLRAFLNGKFDLSQAEAVADLIASQSKGAHDMAISQMRGGYSKKIKELRDELINFASLIELELDFSEEDVEFANRDAFKELINKIIAELTFLVTSFEWGNVIKQGIPVAIVGEPNVGKSTLLNSILNEEKAIVSEIPGTTRDAIEDTIVIGGISFRFIDTAGLRSSSDVIENMGIEKTYEKINQAKIILYVFDINKFSLEEIKQKTNDFIQHIKQEKQEKKFIYIANKIDQLEQLPHDFTHLCDEEYVFVSAKRKENIHSISLALEETISKLSIKDQTLVSTLRHKEAFNESLKAMIEVKHGFEQHIPSDLIATDIRTALHHLGTITGEITTTDLLKNIFSKFCIGK